MPPLPNVLSSAPVGPYLIRVAAVGVDVPLRVSPATMIERSGRTITSPGYAYVPRSVRTMPLLPNVGSRLEAFAIAGHALMATQTHVTASRAARGRGTGALLREDQVMSNGSGVRPPGRERARPPRGEGAACRDA